MLITLCSKILQGSYVFVMRTYKANQVINFPLNVHVSTPSRGILYSQDVNGSFGWRKIDLEDVLNGFKKKTDSDGTNGAFRLLKTGHNYASLELARPFDTSCYTRLGKCIFYRGYGPKNINNNELSKAGGELADADFPDDPPLKIEGVGFDDLIEGNFSSTPPLFDEFGDPIAEATVTLT